MIRAFLFILFLSGCSSSIVISQSGCPRSNILLGEPRPIEDLKKEFIWMPKAPFSREEVVLFKKEDGRCPSEIVTPVVVKDDFLSVLFSFIPFFSQSSIFYIH